MTDAASTSAVASADPQSARGYHHGNLRAALIEAGLAITRSGGPMALSLREATRRVGVSPNAVYRHFTDRSSLLRAVSEQLQAQVAAQMAGSSGTPASSGRARLRTVGLAYIDFALREPGWFETAFGNLQPAPFEPGAATVALPAPLTRLVQALDDAVADGDLEAHRRAGAEWSCWSTVHGFALLVLHGPLRGQPPAVLHRAAERAVDDIVTGVLR